MTLQSHSQWDPYLCLYTVNWEKFGIKIFLLVQLTMRITHESFDSVNLWRKQRELFWMLRFWLSSLLVLIRDLKVLQAEEWSSGSRMIVVIMSVDASNDPVCANKVAWLCTKAFVRSAVSTLFSWYRLGCSKLLISYSSVPPKVSVELLEWCCHVYA